MLERVFDPFFRIEESRNPETGGTGLGLSIARNIADLHAGTLTLRNAEGGGLEATLTLPRLPARLIGDAPVTAPSSGASQLR
jgi:signal transduction histidine kinase